MNKQFALGLTALAALALSACSGSSKQDVANETDSTVQTDSLQGTYTSDCTNVPGAVLGLSSYNTRYVIGGHFDVYKTFYSSNDCQNEVLDIHTQVEYSVHGNQPQSASVPDKTAIINYTYKHELVTPKTQALVDAMNTLHYCGITNWSVQGTADTPAERNVDNVAGNVAVCFGTDKLMDYFDLMNTQGGQLRFGEATLINDKTADSKRPVSLDSTVVAHQ